MSSLTIKKNDGGSAIYANVGDTVTLYIRGLDGFNPTSATGVLFGTAVTPTINGNTVTVIYNT